MKYIRKFSTPEDREAYMASTPAPDMPYMHLVESTGEVKFSSPEVDVPLYIKALGNVIVKFGNTYEYSKDNVTWTSATSSTSISAVAGEMVFFRASGLTASSSSGIGSFTISNGDYYVGGNIMSIIYGADFKGKTEITQTYQFYRLFYSSSSTGGRIVDASGLALPATTLTNNCYNYMFYNQHKITNAPALPATTLASNCYYNMFKGCASLVNAPSLPAMTLTSYCYAYMFQGCTSLVNASVMYATSMEGERQCQNMYDGCTSLVNIPPLGFKTLSQYCCMYMFKDCTSLVSAPVLPVTSLTMYCYSYMFQGCASLVTAPELPATTLASNCYQNMFTGCTSLVNAPALPATKLANYCYQYMFYGCTSLVNAPALPATTLYSRCYQYMFQGCTSLNYIKAMFTTTPSTTYLQDWVSGVSASGTFVKNSAATWDNLFGISAIPTGWTVELADA